jgi:uncharacterized OsmC-like protein
MTVKNQSKLNGVDVDRLIQTVNAVKENPDLARFKFRATSKWMGGGRSQTIIKDFYGAGQEDTSRSGAFVIEGDEPSVLLGNDRGPNAVESVLQALASCLMVGFSYNAAAQGITVNSIEFDLEGELNLHGFLGLSDDIRPGYEGIKLVYRTDCDASPEKVAELWAHVQKTSPVLDILRNPVSVTITSIG